MMKLGRTDHVSLSRYTCFISSFFFSLFIRRKKEREGERKRREEKEREKEEREEKRKRRENDF